MASKSQTTREIVIDLERDGPQTPWGIRLVGGSDMDLPLIITKVFHSNNKKSASHIQSFSIRMHRILKLKMRKTKAKTK